MASSIDIVPSLGQGLSFLQRGPGISPGYGAIDRRRMLAAAAVREGLVHENAYKVTAAGTGLTVTVAADQGLINVQGDSVAQQGIYTVAPHSSSMTLDIAPGHATLPRNDLLVIDALDDEADASGLNKGRVRVITGTPTTGAVKTDALGVHGTPTLGNSQYPLAVVNVPALDTVIDSTQIDDRRLRTSGFLSIPTTESRTNTAFGALTTPDRIPNIVLPAGYVLGVMYWATWQESVVGAANAALFLGANQLSVTPPSGGPSAQSTIINNTSAATDTPLVSCPQGLKSKENSSGGSAYSGDVTTGQAIAISGSGSQPFGSVGGPCYIFAAAGTYDVSVQFKASSGSVTAKNRRLWVWTQPFPT